MACKFFADNGKPSILYNDLANKYNDNTAETVWLKTKTSSFKDVFKERLEFDENGEPTLIFLENNNQVPVSTNTGIPDFFVSDTKDINSVIKRGIVLKAFEDVGVDIFIEENDNLSESGKVMTKNNRLTIQISPFKIKEDTYFHEAGHILIDMIGEDSELIQKGIEQVRNTKLWNDIQKTYPELSGIKLGKEVLTTAIGIESLKEFDEKQQNKFTFWLNQFFRKLGELFGIEQSVAKRLARQLINGKVKEQLDTRVKIEEQYQRDLKLVNSVFQTKQDLLEKAGNIIKKKIAIYYSSLTEAEKASNPTYKKFQELKELFENLTPGEINSDIIRFLTLIYEQTGLLERRINQIVNPTPKDIEDGLDKVSFQFMNTLIQYNETFNIIEDLVDIIKQEEGGIEGLYEYGNDKGLIENDNIRYIEEIYGRYTKVKKSAKRITIKMLSQYYLSLPGKSKLELAKREELEREYNERHKEEEKIARNKGGDTRRDFKNKRREYIDAKVREERPELHRKELERYEVLLEQSDHDIGWMSRMFLDGDTIDDELINIVSEVLDKADFDTMNSVNKEYRNLEKIVSEYEKTHKEGNQQRKYDGMIEDEVDVNAQKTGNKTNKLISKYYSEFYNARRESWKIYNELQAKKEAGQDVEEAELTDAFLAVKKWNKENTINIGSNETPIYVPSERWENPQWTKMKESNDDSKKLFDSLVNRLEEDDSNLPESYKLGKDSFGIMQYKLPSITKLKLESIYDGTLMNNVKERYKAFKEGKQEDETEFGTDLENVEAIVGEPVGSIGETINRYMKVLVNEVGEEKHRVPIYFRYDVKNKDQSYDLPSLVLLNHYMSKNYTNKLEIQPQVELTLDMVKERKVPVTFGTGFSGLRYKIDKILSTNLTNIPVTKTGENSNATKALQSLVEDRLYGIASASNITATRIARAIASYTGNVTLIGNYLSAGANLAFGVTAEWIESIGGVYFDKKNLANAHLKYSTELVNGQLLNDFGKRVWKSRTNLLVEKFNALADWSAVQRRFMNDSRVRMLAGTHTLHFLNSSAEHMMQSMLMYAVLDNVKVMNSEGLYLTKDGVTDDVKKAMSLDEVYKEFEDGLILDPRVSFVQLPSGKVEFDGDTEFLVGRLIKDLNAELHGQYGNDKKAEIQRYWYGTLIMLLRKWLPRGVVRRWRGIESATIPTDQLLLSDKFYSRPGQNRREGYYTTTTRFVWNLLKQGKKLKWEMASTDWSKLTDYERSNIRKMVYEFALMVSMLGLATALKKLGDDEENEKGKKMWYLISFYSYRLHSELITYINPVEATRILRSPSAALTMVNRGLHLLYQLTTNPFEEYVKGDRKGQLKLRKDAEDLVPIIKQIDRNVEDALQWLFSPRVI